MPHVIWIDPFSACGDPSKKIFDRDVPKYTQIGNAVPVRLAFELGKRVARLLRDSTGRK